MFEAKLFPYDPTKNKICLLVGPRISIMKNCVEAIPKLKLEI